MTPMAIAAVLLSCLLLLGMELMGLGGRSVDVGPIVDVGSDEVDEPGPIGATRGNVVEGGGATS